MGPKGLQLLIRQPRVQVTWTIRSRASAPCLAAWGAGDLESAHSKAEAQAEEAAAAVLSTALLEKQLKSKLSIAADHFNRAPSKGLDYFQVLLAWSEAGCAGSCRKLATASRHRVGC